MNKIELVAIDLDGTLLAHDGRLPQRNVEAIARVQALGVGVTLATGKSYWSAVDVIAQLGLSLPGVFSQGLIICAADGTILHEITLDEQLVDDVFAYLEERHLPYLAYNRDGLLTPDDDAYHARADISGKYAEPPLRIEGPMNGRAAELHVNKFLIGDPLDLQARRADLQQRFGHVATIMQAVPEYLEFIPPHTSKGAGLGWLLAYLGIAPEAVLAIGDGENDIEMLQLAGTGVTLRNAQPKVQKKADYVVGSNDEAGVAEALERFVLSKMPDTLEVPGI